jgi:F-type H+-transporting ATPase subunit alpha
MVLHKAVSSHGILISVGYGVITYQGLIMSFIGSVFRIHSISSTPTYGVVVNLYRDSTMHLLVGALVLNPENRFSEGSSLTACHTLASITVGDHVISSILDPMGISVYSSGRIDVQCSWVIESPSPTIILRQSVSESLQTGLISIDSMIPVGRGQRELLIGDRQTGKTSISTDAIINQKYTGVYCVYDGIAEKASSICRVFLSLIRRDAAFYLTLVYASASSSGLCQFLCAYSGSALSEFFMLTHELPSFLILDDLSRHAISYREIYLLLRRPPGREAYPGEIFFVHSRLLERSAKLSFNLGGSSITSFPLIETLAGDVSAYIPTNLISITDGQIFLSGYLFLSGIKPSIDVGLSVTRLGSSAQWHGMKIVAGSYKLELSQFIELQSFSEFAADVGQETKDRLAKGSILVEVLKQFSGCPIKLSHQLPILSLGNQDILISLPVKEVQLFISLYLSIPTWISLYLPPRVLGKSLVTVLS